MAGNDTVCVLYWLVVIIISSSTEKSVGVCYIEDEDTMAVILCVTTEWMHIKARLV